MKRFEHVEIGHELIAGRKPTAAEDAAYERKQKDEKKVADARKIALTKQANKYRDARRRGTLDEQTIATLNSVGFDWRGADQPKAATVDIYNDDDLGFVCTAWEPDTYDEGPPKEIIHETFSREPKESDLRWSQQIPFNRLLTRLWQAGYTKVAWGNAWDEQPPTWAKKMIHRFNTDGFAVPI